MTELLWILLGLAVGLVAGYLVPRSTRRAAPPTDETLALRGQLGKLRSDLDDARLETARALQGREGLEKQIKDLQVRLPRLEGFERANADLRLQLQGFDAVKQKLDAVNAELAAARPKLLEAEALSARLEAALAELSALKTRTAGFEGFQQRAALSTDLEAKLAGAESERARLVKEASEAALKASDAEAAQKKLRVALDEAIQEVARTRDGMQQFAALKNRIDDLESRGLNPEAQARIDALERDLAAARGQAAALEADAHARQELQQTQLRVLDLERQVASLPALRDELHQRNAELTAARDRIAALEVAQHRIASLETALGATEAELERLRAGTAPETGG